MSDRDTVLACFEATATSTFAWICRLVGWLMRSAFVLAGGSFSELPPYTVELVDDAGTSLRLLTP